MWDIVCITVCLVFTTVFFILRTYVRLGVHKQWILEDCRYSLQNYQSTLTNASRHVLRLLREILHAINSGSCSSGPRQG